MDIPLEIYIIKNGFKTKVNELSDLNYSFIPSLIKSERKMIRKFPAQTIIDLDDNFIYTERGYWDLEYSQDIQGKDFTYYEIIEDKYNYNDFAEKLIQNHCLIDFARGGIIAGGGETFIFGGIRNNDFINYVSHQLELMVKELEGKYECILSYKFIEEVIVKHLNPMHIILGSYQIDETLDGYTRKMMEDKNYNECFNEMYEFLEGRVKYDIVNLKQ